MKLEGKVGLITGAGRGIGRSIALKLAREGARVVVNDLEPGVAEDALQAVRSAGGEGVACPGNVAAADFPQRFIQTAIDAFGGLDIIVNNAGYTWDNVIQKMSDEQWSTMLDVHLTGPFRILRAAQPVVRSLYRKDESAGRRVVRKVVNVSSMAGLFGNAGQVNYASAKAGLGGLTRTLAKEWGRMNVTVNCVAYGLIDTRLTAARGPDMETTDIAGRAIKIGINPSLMEEMLKSIPLGRAGSPEEAAGAVYLLCIPESDYISGQTLTCSGGLMGI